MAGANADAGDGVNRCREPVIRKVLEWAIEISALGGQECNLINAPP